MNDLFFILVPLIFFGVAFAYVRGCARLQGDDSNES